jgi:CRP-like cAMP-binding protein
MKHLEMDAAAYRSLAHTASQLEFFSTLKGVELDHMLSRIQLYAYSSGETIFKKGAPADALYIIHEGEIVIRLSHWYALIRKAAHLGPGNLLGEMGLLDNRLRRATAVARSNAKLFVLLRPDFEDLLRRSPAFAAGVQWLADRRRFEDDH